jgi:hypothetical protein
VEVDCNCSDFWVMKSRDLVSSLCLLLYSIKDQNMLTLNLLCFVLLDCFLIFLAIWALGNDHKDVFEMN